MNNTFLLNPSPLHCPRKRLPHFPQKFLSKRGINKGKQKTREHNIPPDKQIRGSSSSSCPASLLDEPRRK